MADPSTKPEVNNAIQKENDQFAEENETIIENPDLPDDDFGTPSLTSFFILEGMKWGSIALVLYIAIRMLDPLWSFIYSAWRSIRVY